MSETFTNSIVRVVIQEISRDPDCHDFHLEKESLYRQDNMGTYVKKSTLIHQRRIFFPQALQRRRGRRLISLRVGKASSCFLRHDHFPNNQGVESWGHQSTCTLRIKEQVIPNDPFKLFNARPTFLFIGKLFHEHNSSR